ncbi:dephospho-CoA kinase [Pedobacter sp. P351]|uniref:dephospho-CoA kinase n=1 Tax=Pedobacter superstes TaxID=3133441 RepID=UPI00309A7540
MLKIGITGGIGSGKTTVCKLFQLQNIPVFYADQQAKTIMQTDTRLVDDLKAEFGQDVYSKEGLLDRRKLGGLVFNDEQKLKQLNSLVHPAVFRAFDVWVKQQHASYVLKEAALLFESGSYKDCDYVILVKSPKDLKVKRIIERDSISESDVLKRMNKQLSDEEKEKKSDFILYNDEKQMLISQVLKLHEIFLKLAVKVK